MRERAQSDVCLIVEGAYPYVIGGVANWLQDLMVSLPDLSFSIIAIKPDEKPLEWKIAPPSNVVEIVEVSLLPRTTGPRKYPSRAIERLATALLEFLTHGQRAVLVEIIQELSRLNPAPQVGDILSSPQMFELFKRYYAQHCPAASFHHYFWAMRILLGGLLSMMLAPIPKARVYHSLSTGFAGLLATRATYETGRPAFLTEHGIYLLERQIEVLMADWIGDQIESGLSLDREDSDLRDLWSRVFETYTRACYEACDPIISLYTANSLIQKRLGAPPERLKVIANGIDPEQFPARLDERDPDHPLVALIGRVVPIKDIKTFIRAAAVVRKQMPNARFVVLGPEDEDAHYSADCRALVADLGIADVFSFAGRVNVGEWLPRIDVLCLTSLSEAQPLVILEAGIGGIPVVAPNVGSCREMIEGRDPSVDQPGGIITSLVAPEDTARALLHLLREPAEAARMGATLQQRVRHDYDKASIVAEYRGLYRSLGAQASSDVQASLLRAGRPARTKAA